MVQPLPLVGALVAGVAGIINIVSMATEYWASDSVGVRGVCVE